MQPHLGKKTNVWHKESKSWTGDFDEAQDPLWFTSRSQFQPRSLTVAAISANRWQHSNVSAVVNSRCVSLPTQPFLPCVCVWGREKERERYSVALDRVGFYSKWQPERWHCTWVLGSQNQRLHRVSSHFHISDTRLPQHRVQMWIALCQGGVNRWRQCLYDRPHVPSDCLSPKAPLSPVLLSLRVGLHCSTPTAKWWSGELKLQYKTFVM